MGSRSCALKFWEIIEQLELTVWLEELFLGGPGRVVCTLCPELLVDPLHVHSGAAGVAFRSLPA